VGHPFRGGPRTRHPSRPKQRTGGHDALGSAVANISLAGTAHSSKIARTKPNCFLVCLCESFEYEVLCPGLEFVTGWGGAGFHSPGPPSHGAGGGIFLG